MIRKSVAFNPKDPDQAAMLQHAGARSNFSAYVKLLIFRDMAGVISQPAITVSTSKNLMEGFV